jgi:ankyrin repeat protein
MNQLQIGKKKEIRLQKPDFNGKKLETEKPISETQKRLNNNLLLAAQDGNYNKIKILLETGADIEARNRSGTTPLIVAAHNGFIKACELLIEKGADVNAVSKNGQTALMIASWYEHKGICALLIENGADMGAKDNRNWTVLMHAENACRHGTIAFLKFAAYIDSSMGKDSFRTFLSDFRECIES